MTLYKILSDEGIFMGKKHKVELGMLIADNYRAAGHKTVKILQSEDGEAMEVNDYPEDFVPTMKELTYQFINSFLLIQ